MKSLIFSTHEKKYFWYLPERFFFFIYIYFCVLRGHFLSNFAWLSAFSGLLCHFNEWITRNLRFEKAA